MAGNQDDVDSILVAPDELGKILIIDFKDGKMYFTKKIKFSSGAGAVTSTPHASRVRPRLHHHSFHGERHGRLRSYSVSFQVCVQVKLKSKQNLKKKNFDISGKWFLLS